MSRTVAIFTPSESPLAKGTELCLSEHTAATLHVWYEHWCCFCHTGGPQSIPGGWCTLHSNYQLHEGTCNQEQNRSKYTAVAHTRVYWESFCNGVSKDDSAFEVVVKNLNKADDLWWHIICLKEIHRLSRCTLSNAFWKSIKFTKRFDPCILALL